MKPEISPPPAAWMRPVLVAAAVYNLAFGVWTVSRPLDLFRLTGAPTPIYPGIWQCVGMIVGVYGVGYWIASRNPLRHWPIVLVGLLGKIFGPIGMLHQWWTLPADAPVVETGRLPASWLWLNVTNDLIWIVPFAAILYAAFKAASAPSPTGEFASPAQANRSVRSQDGRTLSQINADRPCLLVFLRHSGCTFCREALADLAENRPRIEPEANLALVHMGEENADTAAFFDRYGLGDVPRFSDPDAKLYRAYELGRGRVGQLFGRGVWWRGFVAAIVNRHGVGKLGGDGFQMPGAFVIHRDEIIREYRHDTAASRPAYEKLLCVA